jgi:uncharacterized membrane protein YuzA (DUF378 family)
MKSFDILATVLLIVGGLNWGLVGLLKFDLVATLLGNGTVLSSIVYVLVGLAAVYQTAGLKAIQRRWGVAVSRA